MIAACGNDKNAFVARHFGCWAATVARGRFADPGRWRLRGARTVHSEGIAPELIFPPVRGTLVPT